MPSISFRLKPYKLVLLISMCICIDNSLFLITRSLSPLWTLTGTLFRRRKGGGKWNGSGGGHPFWWSSTSDAVAALASVAVGVKLLHWWPRENGFGLVVSSDFTIGQHVWSMRYAFTHGVTWWQWQSCILRVLYSNYITVHHDATKSQFLIYMSELLNSFLFFFSAQHQNNVH